MLCSGFFLFCFVLYFFEVNPLSTFAKLYVHKTEAHVVVICSAETDDTKRQAYSSTLSLVCDRRLQGPAGNCHISSNL